MAKGLLRVLSERLCSDINIDCRKRLCLRRVSRFGDFDGSTLQVNKHLP